MANQDYEKSYLYIWKFHIRSEKEAEFLKIYGSDGEWVQLFRKGVGYVHTLLVKDLDSANVYTTIDIWESETANKVFKTEFAAELEALDMRCEKLTENEVLAGRFEVV